MNNGDPAPASAGQTSTILPDSEQSGAGDRGPVGVKSEEFADNSDAVEVGDNSDAVEADTEPSSDKGIAADTFASYEPATRPVEDYMFAQRAPWDFEHYQEMYRRRSWLYLFIALAVLVAGLGSVLGFFLMLEHRNYHPLAGALIIAGSWLVAIVIIVGGRLFVIQKIRLRSTGALPSRRKETVVDERTLNQQSLKKYHDLTQQQAGSSYIIAQLAILVGLLLLIGAGYIVVKASAPTAQIVVGALGVVGSTLSGYVGATSIRMYNRAQAQMNFYYAQPLVQSYILEAERISNCLSPKRKDSALEKVIAQTLEGAAVAGYLISRGSDESLPNRSFRTKKSSASTTNKVPPPVGNSASSDGLATKDR